jgi:hypothetical protein
VTIADGATASPGDLIICTRNDHTVQAGEPGRTLANGDLLRIDAITRRGLVVRRALDADPATGQRRWIDRHFVFNSYQDAELGYAVTDHVAQGRTVTAGLAVITGAEDRPHALVALTRGITTNLAYVFTRPPKRADPVPGPRPAPEPARYDNKRAERPGLPVPPISSAPPGQALAVLTAELAGLDPAQLLAAAIAERDLAGSRPGRRHRRPPPPPPRRRRPAPGRPVVRPGPRPHRHRTPLLPGADRHADGRTQGPDRRARRRPRPALGRDRPGPGPWPPAGPAGLAAPSRLHRRLAGTVRLRPSRRPDRPRTRRRRSRPAHRLAAVRATAEAEAAQRRGQPGEAARQQALASGYRAMHDAYRDREATFAAVMADRADWDAATRHLAVAADTELRRRHPARNYPPLRSAEPPPPSQARRDSLTLTAGEQAPEPAQWIKDLTAQRRAFAGRLASHHSLMVPAEDPDYGDLGHAFPPWPAPARQPILQPPRPEIQPSEQILERAADRETD